MSLQKAFGVESVKTVGEAGSGKFEALVSVFGNVDSVKDRVLAGAFARAVKDSQPPPVVWSHHWMIPPIGETLDWGEADKGLKVQGALFVGAEDKHQYADMVYAAMKSREGRPPALREFSFSYDIPEGGQEQKTETVDGRSMVVNDIKEFFPVHEVGPCLRGCNPATEMLMAPKSVLDRAKLSDAQMERLEKLAAKQGKSLDDLLALLEEGFEFKSKDAVPVALYPRQLFDVLTASPGH
jgi:uncharacterized protein